MTSPRRMGKTQLIHHVYNQKAIVESYYTFYVDIYSTTSLHEFILLLSKEIYSELIPKGKKFLDSFISVLKSLSGCFGYDPLFYYEPFGKTFAEVELSKKNEVSHRAIAVKQFIERLSQVLNDDE